MEAESSGAVLAETVVSGAIDELPARMAALLRYAAKLTLTPWEMTENDLAPLRSLRLTDRDIVDANQVVAYFNYVNRVADGLGVELEDRWPDEVRAPRTYPLRDTFGDSSSA